MNWPLRMRSLFLPVIFCLLLVLPLSAGAQSIETPPDLKPGDTLPGPLGIYYERGEGFLNVRIVDNRFRLYFLEEDKETLVEPGFSEAIIHYGNAVRRGLNRNTTTLELAGGQPYLMAARIIPPPHRYWVQIVVPERPAPPPAPGFPVNPNAKPVQTEETFPMEVLNQITDQSPVDGDS